MVQKWEPPREAWIPGYSDPRALAWVGTLDKSDESGRKSRKDGKVRKRAIMLLLSLLSDSGLNNVAFLTESSIKAGKSGQNGPRTPRESVGNHQNRQESPLSDINPRIVTFWHFAQPRQNLPLGPLSSGVFINPRSSRVINPGINYLRGGSRTRNDTGGERAWRRPSGESDKSVRR